MAEGGGVQAAKQNGKQRVSLLLSLTTTAYSLQVDNSSRVQQNFIITAHNSVS